MNKWINEGGIFFPVGDFKLYSSPGPGVFELATSPNPMDNRLGLLKVGEKFEFPYKIYDLGIDDFLNKIKKTWNNEYFEKKQQNLGIILNGIKGTGKTCAAKVLCNDLELPVIVIPGYIDGMQSFISSLEFECVILLDEAEKMFEATNNGASQALLKLIDGVMNKSRKLYILTTNTLKLNENLLGRPGRIRYIKEFRNISPKCIMEYIKDNLEDKSKTKDILKLIDSLEISTIDTLRSIVDEVNIHNELENVEEFNLTFNKNYSSAIGIHFSNIDLAVNRGECEKKFNQLKKFIDEHKPKGDYFLKWIYNPIDVSKLAEPCKKDIKRATLGVGAHVSTDTDKLLEDLSPYLNVEQPSTVTIESYLGFTFGANNYNLEYAGNLSIGSFIKYFGTIKQYLGDNCWVISDGGGEYYLYLDPIDKSNSSLYRGELVY